MDLFLAHSLLLIWASLGAARKLAAHAADRLLMAALLAWGNIVVTSLVLSGLHRLGEPAWFFGTSLLLATLMALAAGPIPAATPVQVPAPADGGKSNPWLVAAFLLTLVPLAGANAWIAWTYQPGGEDALSYHLPRAMYYLGQNSLAHFDASDLRLTRLPFNFNLLQAFGLIYGPPLQVLNLFNFAAWVVSGLAVYQLCRRWACGVNASLLTTWLALTAPPCLAAATAATPGLAGGAALACAGVFTLQWRQTGQRRHAVLAGLAAGLAAGSSLGLFFITPVLVLGAAWSARKRAGFARSWILPVSLAVVIGAPFACINLAGEGRLLATALLVQQWRSSGLRELLPALLLLSPCLAVIIERLTAGPLVRRAPGWGLLLAVAFAASWSGATDLLVNPDRPLGPRRKGAAVRSEPPALPLLLEFRLKDQHRINVDSDGVNEPIFPILHLGDQPRITARGQPVPEAYNLLSRSALSRITAYADLDRRPVYALLPMPAKPTGGVEFLATVGRSGTAREYFGLAPRAGWQDSIDSNRMLLLTLYRVPSATAQPPRTRIKLAGLNAGDLARVVVEAVYAGPPAAPVTVATLTADGETTATITEPFERLDFRAFSTQDEKELGSASVAYRSNKAESPQLDPDQPSGPLSLFVTDLVLSRETHGITLEGFLPTEGPFPQWDLPFLRWAKQPVVSIRLPAFPRLARLQLSFSIRLHVRKRGQVEVAFNGHPVERCRIEGQTVWLDRTLELIPQPGENVLEFRDLPLESGPDWLDYLERYPDVKKHVVVNHLPLEQGAREHYETSGRREGRTIQMTEPSGPPPESYYFMFRNIRLEGFKSP